MLLWASRMLQVSCFAFKWMNATLKREDISMPLDTYFSKGWDESPREHLVPFEGSVPCSMMFTTARPSVHIINLKPYPPNYILFVTLPCCPHKKSWVPIRVSVQHHNKCPTIQTKEKAPMLVIDGKEMEVLQKTSLPLNQAMLEFLPFICYLITPWLCWLELPLGKRVCSHSDFT